MKIRCILIAALAWAWTAAFAQRDAKAREVLDVLWTKPGMSATDAAASLGYRKTDTGALEATIETVLADNPDMVAIVKGGNLKLVNALTGKVMKASNPKPNPKIVTEILMAKLGL